jgi:hypothetical protein
MPIVVPTRSQQAKCKRLKALRELAKDLSDDEVAVYEDEANVHVNPKIGLDWMVIGQKRFVPPGQNEKRYLARALNAKTGELIWVEADSTNSLPFSQLLWKLHHQYINANKIYVILDNYSIHISEEMTLTLATAASRRFAECSCRPIVPIRTI